jgi:hypothetical protein
MHLLTTVMLGSHGQMQCNVDVRVVVDVRKRERSRVLVVPVDTALQILILCVRETDVSVAVVLADNPQRIGAHPTTVDQRQSQIDNGEQKNELRLLVESQLVRKVRRRYQT